MPSFSDQQIEVVNLFTKIIDLCILFINTCVKLFDNIVSILVTPISLLAPQWLSFLLGVSPVFAPFQPLLTWLIENPTSFLGQLTVLELIFGSGFLFYIGYTIVKWILGLVK